MADALRGAVIGAGGVARLRHIPAFQEAARRGTGRARRDLRSGGDCTGRSRGSGRDWRAVSGLSGGAGARRHRRRHHRDAELVARADRDRGIAGRQARALRKAPGPVARRGEADGRGGPGRRPRELGELPLPLGAGGAIPERAGRDRRGRRGAADLHELLQRVGAGPNDADPVAADPRRGGWHPGRHRIAPDRPGVVARWGRSGGCAATCGHSRASGRPAGTAWPRWTWTTRRPASSNSPPAPSAS